MPEWAVTALEFLAITVEGVGYAILLFTVVTFIFRYVAFLFQRLRGFECIRRFRDIRLELMSHILLAIDFMVISDIIHTGLVQTRDSLITLGVFVLIRSALAFLLSLEIKDTRSEKQPSSSADD